MDTKQAKHKFGIIGNNFELNRAIQVALQVAPTDISVLINGESGTGKENIPKIIHQNSKRKHNPYVAINCGAIPEGTIDSELFGHEKGSFTGAHDHRKGYFETANGGTIFLDEVAELPLSTQVRLLRVLETGEFIKVGSSKTQKTDIRVVAATNVNINIAVRNNKFREDLYYRLNTINIQLPPLRKRKEDILMLFRKFATDFSEKYKTTPLHIESAASKVLEEYSWPGNIRQLKNFVAQLCIIEKQRIISEETLKNVLPVEKKNSPMLIDKEEKSELSEREILYKVLFDMKKDITELKKITFDLIERNSGTDIIDTDSYPVLKEVQDNISSSIISTNEKQRKNPLEIEESLSLFEQEKKLIEKALKKYKGKRKSAAKELGISERTLYRKLKEFDI
ncbi:MAG: sigma-54 dependent transcriptional regulator [Bacteroidota bacterium]|nr:sigma-54 dependent transcriptional regulator [Bacteroidota bacterium]